MSDPVIPSCFREKNGIREKSAGARPFPPVRAAGLPLPPEGVHFG